MKYDITLDEIDEMLKALNTQYQFRSSAIIPRNSDDAPTIEQLGIIRQAHLSLFSVLKQLKEYKLKEQTDAAKD